MNSDRTDALRSVQQTLKGQYVLDRELGRGGMGVVYLAREIRLDRAVAVKVLPRHLGTNPELRERFLREARTAAQLSHPNIVPIFRADELDGIAFFTMAFIDGETLAERLHARGTLPPADAVRILRETAWALAYAHARGVVHRDVKPENIMIERNTNRVIVTDFGIARDQLAVSLTQDGMVLGSVHYMSPEQAAGDSIDGRSDLYALGVVGFEILSGTRPFNAVEAAAVMAQHVTKPAPSLGTVMPALPRTLVAVIDQCLQKAREDRFPNGEALADALQRTLQTPALLTNGGGGASDETVSTGQARAIWQRAAQLQSEASARLEARYRQQPETGHNETDVNRATGFRMREVERAAVEACIGTEFVAMAIAEGPAATGTALTELTEREDRTFTRMLGTSDRSIACSRRFQHPPHIILETIGRVFTVNPFAMKLRDTIGGHPLDGGILVFEVPLFRSGSVTLNERGGVSMFSYRMTQLEVDRLNVLLKPTDTGGCEVTVYGDLRRGMGKNWRVDKWVAGSLATGGAVAGGTIGAVGLALGAVAVATAFGGAAVAGVLSLAGYRLVYRSALRYAKAEIEGLLGSIDVNLKAASVFGRAPGTSALSHFGHA